MKHVILTFFILSTPPFAYPDDAKQFESSKAKPLFNGKNLTGWKGDTDLWSVENGAIVGRTTQEAPIKANAFLIYDDEQPSNFELVLSFKIESGNSGVQYRSRIFDETRFIAGGYQADIDFGNGVAGILYEERGRGILAMRGEKVTIAEDGTKNKELFGKSSEIGRAIYPGKWNQYRIVANGNHLRHYINKTLTAEVIDRQTEKAATAGVIAFQLHVGGPMVVRFKDISLRPLN